MDITLLIALGAVSLLLILVIGAYLKYNTQQQPKENRDRPRPQPNRLREGAPRRAQLARNRGARLRANHQDRQESDGEGGEQLNQADEETTLIPDNVGAKKRAKLEAKAEKKALREAEEKVRADKKQREKQAEEERRKFEEREQLEEKQREEEEKRLREEKEKREYEEYLRMKEAFSVEEEGYEEGEQGDETNLLKEFVSYIRSNKVVVIEDLAAQFKLKTQAAIDRIRDLQEDNILTGVIDDRGKFIYVSQEEMDAVAKFIRQRGRVSIAELADNSNKLIDLTPVTVNSN